MRVAPAVGRFPCDETLVLEFRGPIVFTVAAATLDMRAELSAFLETGMTPASLRLIFDDLHGLHGGLHVSISGTGEVVQIARGAKVFPPHDRVPMHDVLGLVQLAIDLEAWQQRLPDRLGVPDEGRTTFTIRVGAKSSEIWAWSNDRHMDDRFVRLRDEVTRVAWNRTQPPRTSWPPMEGECPGCGGSVWIDKDNVSPMMKAIRRALEGLRDFRAEVDWGQFCDACRTWRQQQQATDLRESASEQYPSILIRLDHDNLTTPAWVVVGDDDECRTLVRILNGEEVKRWGSGSAAAARNWCAELRARL